MSDAPVGPGDAKKILYEVIRIRGVLTEPAYIASDLANLRRAMPHDVDFANAILAVAREIKRALLAPSDHGIAVQHELRGWRRSKFSSSGAAPSDLRLVFRQADAPGVEILAFGDRDFPDSVYHTAKRRT